MDTHAVDEKKRLPVRRIFALTAVSVAIDLGYAVVGSYATPFLLATGLSLKYASLTLSLSPFLGILFQAYLGSVSDKCKCSYGRRRPFIVLFGTMAVLAIGLAPHVFYLQYIKGLPFDPKTAEIAAAVACVVTFDFSIGALELPTRTYLLDAVPLSQAQLGNFIYIALAGLGATLGYILGGIDWSSVLGLRGVNSIPQQVQVVFRIVVGVTILCVVITVCSVKECQYIDRTCLSNENRPLENTCISTDQHCMSDCGFRPLGCLKQFIASFVDIYRFVCHMSWQMWLLCTWILLANFGMFSFDYFFTVFMGEVVFEGDSQAPEFNTSYLQYADGVRMGSWALTIAAFISVLVALSMDFITRWVRLKTVVLFFLSVYVVCCGLLYCIHEVPIVFALAASYGPFLALLFSVPYTMIAIYEVSICSDGCASDMLSILS